ncbi:MCP four helix bundle domain-containing protein [Pedobacter insulae]|uniref:Four helix bundle sensory module for signal transduction n=1 Tax=Pedobacter insulae TaxID=414048 RepID=A0A1I3AH42_9SPHI|nr:MCP four helix bundle domain-containing protein [Pedobacter insulae]SFH48661.1 Four helix bundle sensory module for signal transduction [Pedobacter insulae]
MGFKHTVKQKSKIAIFLFGVMACTILIRLLEDKSIKEMNNAFISMYNDRLIPATDLFYLAENLYAKRYLLESMIEKKSTVSRVELIKKLGVHDANINSLVAKYEKTFLTPQEKKYLEDLKTQLKANNKIEQILLNDQTINNKEDFIQQTNASFNEIAKKLTELTQLQRNVGEELIKDSNTLVSGSNLYSNIQFALAIVIGILIVAIITTSNVVKVANEKFNLN